MAEACTVRKHDVRIPLLAHIPHSATCIPPEVRSSTLLNDDALARELLALTDWYVDELFAAVCGGGVAVVYPVSRLVVDPERFADDAQEVMAAAGMGVIYTRTSAGAALRAQPTADEIAIVEGRH
jgi:N-formylglutamate deformylase